MNFSDDYFNYLCLGIGALGAYSIYLKNHQHYDENNSLSRAAIVNMNKKIEKVDDEIDDTRREINSITMDKVLDEIEHALINNTIEQINKLNDFEQHFKQTKLPWSKVHTFKLLGVDKKYSKINKKNLVKWLLKSNTINDEMKAKVKEIKLD